MRLSRFTHRILFSFLLVIAFLGLVMMCLGFFLIKHDVIARAQRQVVSDLSVADAVYQREIEEIRSAFNFAAPAVDIDFLKQQAGLDYICVISDKHATNSDIAVRAFESRKGVGGTRSISADELRLLGPQAYERCRIRVRPTPHARVSSITEIDSALALEYAQPFIDSSGTACVMYGGKIINNNKYLVDTIYNFVFKGRDQNGGALGTVTLFYDDVRIATTVRDASGQRAIGTRVSEQVYDAVFRKGIAWVDRAFVVTDWYLTAYTPIRNIGGRIVGMLYVGIPEKPFVGIQKQFFGMVVFIIVLATVLAFTLSYALALALGKSLGAFVGATEKLSSGELTHRIVLKDNVREFNELIGAFNRMADALSERDRNVHCANQKLTTLNKNYMEMIGFVAHELKGVLGAVALNVNTVRGGYLGPLTEAQQKALNAAGISLEHFEVMVRSYLNVSRIEQGTLDIHTSAVFLSKDIIAPALADFDKQVQSKGIIVSNDVDADSIVRADKNLMQIVFHNLIGNALKYGYDGGRIRLYSQARGKGDIEITIYNDGPSIPEDQRAVIFEKFSRLPMHQAVSGTGLGLYIVKEIVEKHGGRIWVEPQPAGNVFICIVPRG